MVQGTTSDAGKSTLVTALCRWLARQGVAVVPFAAEHGAQQRGDRRRRRNRPCPGGTGAGRQPAPHTDMNPVLLKPNSDIGAQVIVHGRAVTSMDAAAYHDYKRVALQAVLDSHRRLSAAYRVVMVEGAGSPAEINLRAGDIANMGFAEAVDCPVILIADIDKGGVFAHPVGTLALLSESEQARVQGFVINRFARRYRAAATGAGLAGAAHRQAGTGRAAVPDGSARRPKMPSMCAGRQVRRGPEGGGAGVAADQQPYRLRSAAPASAGRSAIRRTRPARSSADLIILPGSKACVPTSPAACQRLGGGDPEAPALRRQAAWHLRWPADARHAHCRSARAGRPSGRTPGLVCWTSPPCSKPTSSCVTCRAGCCRRVCQSPATRSMPASAPGRPSRARGAAG